MDSSSWLEEIKAADEDFLRRDAADRERKRNLPRAEKLVNEWKYEAKRRFLVDLDTLEHRALALKGLEHPRADEILEALDAIRLLSPWGPQSQAQPSPGAHRPHPQTRPKLPGEGIDESQPPDVGSPVESVECCSQDLYRPEPNHMGRFLRLGTPRSRDDRRAPTSQAPGFHGLKSYILSPLVLVFSCLKSILQRGLSSSLFHQEAQANG